MDNYKINTGYIYKDSFSKKDFIDAVLKKIKDDIYSPSYIFDEMTLSDVSRINVPIILASGDSTIEYSRKLGYDKIVTTTKYKTITYGSGVQNRTQSTSSKTITEWQNDYGTITGSATSGTYPEEYMIYDEYITNHQMDKNNVGQLSSEELSKYSLTEGNIEYLKNDILDKVYKSNITYPAQHVKDEEYSGTTNLYNITCTIVSLYMVQVSIRDKIIQYIASSNGEIEIISFGDYPMEDAEEVFSFNKKISQQRKEATKKPRTIAKYSMISSLVLFIILLIIGISSGIKAIIFISVLIFILGLIITIKFNIDVKRISKPFYKQIYDHNMKFYKEKLKIKDEGYQNYINSRR